MKKTCIGIPKAFLYYRYQILWTKFFEGLGCKVIISNETTKETIENGKKYSIDEACLSSKIYIGHVYNLIGKCDYIFIPRIENYGKCEKVCEEGEIYMKEENKCKNICKEGERYIIERNKCDFKFTESRIRYFKTSIGIMQKT